MPILDISKIRGSAFRPIMKIAFWFFVIDFLILIWLGGQHVEEPYVFIGQLATAFYFSYFLIIVPVVGFIENTIIELAIEKV
jgi:ubiquinol-cytochrome c reductase cytochrome b subunit